MSRPRKPFGAQQPGRLPATMMKVLAAEMSDPQRLRRGKQYAKDGSVLDIVVDPGVVTCEVQGTRCHAVHRIARGHARRRHAAAPRRPRGVQLPRRRQLGRPRLQARDRHDVRVRRRAAHRARTARRLARQRAHRNRRHERGPDDDRSRTTHEPAGRRPRVQTTCPADADTCNSSATAWSRVAPSVASSTPAVSANRSSIRSPTSSPFPKAPRSRQIPHLERADERLPRRPELASHPARRLSPPPHRLGLTCRP